MSWELCILWFRSNSRTVKFYCKVLRCNLWLYILCFAGVNGPIFDLTWHTTQTNTQYAQQPLNNIQTQTKHTKRIAMRARKRDPNLMWTTFLRRIRQTYNAASHAAAAPWCLVYSVLSHFTRLCILYRSTLVYRELRCALLPLGVVCVPWRLCVCWRVFGYVIQFVNT